MLRTNRLLTITLAGLLSSGLALAQGVGGPPPAGPGPDGPDHRAFVRGPMERTFHDSQFGRFWNDPRIAQQLNLTDDQKRKMDDIFQQHRLNLIDLHANLEKQEVLMGPMISADQPNEAQVLAQIDKIAQARADLEKADARMLFDLRKTLTPEQWQKLKAMREEHHDGRMMRERPRPGGPDGQRWQRHGQPPPSAPSNGNSAPAPPPPGTTPPQ
jgi:periplasmic protein CpxP/Spy